MWPGTMKEIRLLIAGGGTGGHLFPGIAIAEELSSLCPLHVKWIGTGRPVEQRVLSERPWQYQVLRVRPFKGRNLGGLLAAVLTLPVSIVRAMVAIRRFKADIVLGVGGYVSGPVLLAGKILRIPTAIHEQNYLPGLANRLAARFADRVYTSFQGSARYFKNKKIECLGNPIRRQILKDALDLSNRVDPYRQFRILVLGGSQGATGLNRIVSSALKILHQSGLKFQVIHQTGPSERDVISASYKSSGMNVKVEPFIERIGIAYSWADLIICRAGATTLAEITAVGKPAICIPFPYAADGHQDLNARTLCEAGAALCFNERDLGAVALASNIEALMNDPARLVEMGKRSKGLGKPDAAKEIALSMLRLCNCDSEIFSDVREMEGEQLKGHV